MHQCRVAELGSRKRMCTASQRALSATSKTDHEAGGTCTLQVACFVPQLTSSLGLHACSATKGAIRLESAPAAQRARRRLSAQGPLSGNGDCLAVELALNPARVLQKLMHAILHALMSDAFGHKPEYFLNGADVLAAHAAHAAGQRPSARAPPKADACAAAEAAVPVLARRHI